MKKVLVSGANGFVGKAVIRRLLEENIEVVALTRTGKLDLDGELSGLTCVEFSLGESDKLSELITDRDFDVFYNFAWQGAAGSDRADTALQLQNVQWNIDCIKLAKKMGCKKFVNAGTIMEIETYEAAFCQENKPGAGYIYGGAKLVAHVMCKAIAASEGIDLVWALITNAYGPGETSPRLVNTTIRKCIQGISPEFTSGTQNYDFVYIDDVARAFVLLGQKGKPFCEYVIGSGAAKPLKEFLLEMKDAVAPELEFKFGNVPFTGVNQALDVFNTDKIFEDTGFTAQVSFAEGCKATKAWMEKNDQ